MGLVCSRIPFKKQTNKQKTKQNKHEIQSLKEVSSYEHLNDSKSIPGVLRFELHGRGCAPGSSGSIPMLRGNF